MYDPNSRNWQKPHLGPDSDPLGSNSGHHFFNLAASFTIYHDQLSSCKISEKRMERHTNGRMKERTDGLTH